MAVTAVAFALLVSLLAACMPAAPAGRTAGRTTPRAKQGEALSGQHRLLRLLRDARSDVVLVAAHRACWKRAPENSLPAIRECLRLGVHIIEIDLRRTRDGRLVLMHDETVDRTTDGSGKVSELTLAQVQRLRLKLPDGIPTEERVPTLEQAVELIRGRCLVNLDKAHSYSRQVHHLLKRRGMLDHAIYKGRAPLKEVQGLLSELRPPPTFMPVLGREETDPARLDGGARDEVVRYVEALRPVAVELIFGHKEDPLISAATVASLRQAGARVWVNSLWDGHLSGGRGDRRAVRGPRAVWGWLIERGVSIIQTDEPELLLRFLAGGRQR